MNPTPVYKSIKIAFTTWQALTRISAATGEHRQAIMARLVADAETSPRQAIAAEWLKIIDTLIEDTAQKYDESQDREDMRFFYAGKRSILNYFRELAIEDAGETT